MKPSPSPTKLAIALIALSALSMSLWRIFNPASPSDGPPDDQAWFYDLVERREFTATARQIPPINSPWGNPAASVIFFSCADCDDRFPGLFMQFNDETKAELEANPEKWSAAFGESYPGRLYSADGMDWVEAPSVEASGVTKELAARCPGKLRVCR